jgi:hypothetical protein
LHISDPHFNKLCHVDEHVILMILGSGLHEKSLGLNMLGNCKALGMVENPTKQKTLFFFVWGGAAMVMPAMVTLGSTPRDTRKAFLLAPGGTRKHTRMSVESKCK